MKHIISPAAFTTVPWKNGLGETIEVAINKGGTLANFDWRLSMASVVEDGLFSNFASYTRNLILIEGDGINLQHNDSKIDRLSNILDIATFDGGNKTVGNLHTGAITDFNVITKTERYNTQVHCLKQADDYELTPSHLCFVFSIDSPSSIQLKAKNETITLATQHLLQLENEENSLYTVSGKNLIIIQLSVK